MPILTINCNARLLELLRGVDSGQPRQYIYSSSPKKKLENQIYIGNELLAEGYYPYIEVKFVSKYSSREKRIEVIGIKDHTVKLYQFTSRSSFDQDSNELARLISEISSLPEAVGYSFNGEVVVLDAESDISVMKQALTEMNLNINLRLL